MVERRVAFTEHHYFLRCEWSGSTKDGYEAYNRSHKVTVAPVGLRLELSSDPTFNGDENRLNPEQLLVGAASSCQLLSFLAVAARARVDVREYLDDAEGVMPENDPPTRITRIILRPQVRVGPGANEEQIRRLLNVAHRECYVANALRSEIVIEPSIVIEES